MTANNPGPFTFHGTNSYLVGVDTLAVIDPGPDDDDHLAALIAGHRADGRSATYSSATRIAITRRSPRGLRRRPARRCCAEGPHRPARPLQNRRDQPARRQRRHAPSRPIAQLGDGDAIAGDGWTIRAVLTPGHAANHAAFALEGTGILFSADHVMAWSTSIVAPPDGAMSDYMASLDRLIARDDRLLLPGHGGPVTGPTRLSCAG